MIRCLAKVKVETQIVDHHPLAAGRVVRKELAQVDGAYGVSMCSQLAPGCTGGQVSCGHSEILSPIMRLLHISMAMIAPDRQMRLPVGIITRVRRIRDASYPTIGVMAHRFAQVKWALRQAL